MSSKDQETLPWPNVANKVDAYIKERWPELYNVGWLWFTGSQVWSHLYGEPVREGADLDIIVERRNISEWSEDSGRVLTRFATPEEEKSWIDQARFYLKVVPPPLAWAKEQTSLGGTIVWTDKGRVDLWVPTNPGMAGVVGAIRNYPSDSHGHCRVAYSTFHRLLLVGTNLKATPQGAMELAERRMIEDPRLALERNT